MTLKVSLGPVYFHWPLPLWLDFYARMADEAELDRVYLGEVVCSKRAPFYEKHYDEVAERLRRGGKEVVFSTLSEVSVRHDRACVQSLCALEDTLVEANDASALYALNGRSHTIGPFINVYNGTTLHELARRGAKHICLPPELPAAAVKSMVQTARKLSITTEIQGYGRISLALSARCYHARALGRTKDNCQYACGADQNGLTVSTLDKKPFLAVNGIQTLSQGCLSLLPHISALNEIGPDFFRLAPQGVDMVQVANIHARVLKGKLHWQDGARNLQRMWPEAPLIDGFFRHTPGQDHIRAGEGTKQDCA